MTLCFDFIGNRLCTCGTLAVSPIIDLPGRPVKSFLHLVQSPVGVFTMGKCLPDMVHFLLEKVSIAAYSFGPMSESNNDTIFSQEMMVAIPL